MALQLRELMWHYGQPVEIFFDGLDHQEKYGGYSFLEMIRTMSFNIMVDNRLGISADYETPEQYVPKRIPVKGVMIQRPNQSLAKNLPTGVPSAGEFRPWETNMTINNTWAYNKNDHDYKSTRHLIRALVDAASRGGNFLLNVGPTPEGTIQPEFQKRLRGVGDWMRVNGDSIYGTTYGPLQELAFARTTAKGKRVYLHVYDWPESGVVNLPPLPRVLRGSMIADGRPIAINQSATGLTFRLPTQTPDPNDTVLVFEMA